MGKDEYKHLVGKLSNHRCPECGRSLYVNAVGSAWCNSPKCDYDDTFDAERLVFLPPSLLTRQQDAELRALLGEDDD